MRPRQGCRVIVKLERGLDVPFSLQENRLVLFWKGLDVVNFKFKLYGDCYLVFTLKLYYIHIVHIIVQVGM